MKRLQGPKVPPRWRKSILQVMTASLTGRLEEFNVAPQPGLRGRQVEREACEAGGAVKTGEIGGGYQSVSHHERSDHNVWHLRQLVVQEGGGGMVGNLATTQPIRALLTEIRQVPQVRKSLTFWNTWYWDLVQMSSWKGQTWEFTIETGRLVTMETDRYQSLMSYLSVFIVNVFTESSNHSSVNEQWTHHDDCLQNLPQGHLTQVRQCMQYKV